MTQHRCDTNIQRIRRLSVKDEWDPCDFCDEPMEVGYHFMGIDVCGPRGGYLNVCDSCLKTTKSSSIGFLSTPKIHIEDK